MGRDDNIFAEDSLSGLDRKAYYLVETYDKLNLKGGSWCDGPSVDGCHLPCWVPRYLVIFWHDIQTRNVQYYLHVRVSVSVVIAFSI